MSERTLFLDRAIGEQRGVVLLDGQPERLLIDRDDARQITRLGARVAARVRKVEPAFASAFLDLGEGQEALLSFKPDARPVEGRMLEIEIRSEARDGKLATARAIGPSDGAPRLLQAAPSLSEQLQAFARDAEVVEDHRARDEADRAEAEALETIHPLPGGGSLAIEPTRALVAIDVDLGERKGHDLKRVTRQANLAALAASARLLRLKGLGGIVVIDLVGRGHDGTALLAAARTAFSADNPGVSIGPVGRFGTMELSIPRRGKSVRELLLDSSGAPTVATSALRLIRHADTAARRHSGAKLEARCSRKVAAAAEPFAELLRARIGHRLTVVAQDGWDDHRQDIVVL
jgi:Ribonuclease G/E